MSLAVNQVTITEPATSGKPKETDALLPPLLCFIQNPPHLITIGMQEVASKVAPKFLQDLMERIL